MNKSNLNEYEKKRDFAKTVEPKGGKSSKEKNIFVIQKHDASRLHYDFRIEIDGVLKSWAVPKGPSTNPKQNRLAMLTEDHPMDYADFEGTIPEDEYGGGSVIVWDAGKYKNLREEKKEGKSMVESFEDGKIEVALQGKKLKGGYVIFKTGKGKDDNKWMLKKMKDDAADARRKPVKSQPKSVLSGKTVEEIAKEMKKDK